MGKFLKESQIITPQILVLVRANRRWERVLIFAHVKYKGTVSNAWCIMALAVEDIKKDPSFLYRDPRRELGERIYLPDGRGGHHDGVSGFKKPTQDELDYCQNIFNAAKQSFNNAPTTVTLPSFVN